MNINWKAVFGKPIYLLMAIATGVVTASTLAKADGYTVRGNVNGNNTSASMSDEATAFAAFYEMNTFDIESASLSISKGESEEVRNLGEMIVADHEPFQSEARRIANTLGLKVYAQGSNAGHAKTIDSLKAASGAAFDKAYMTYELQFSKDFIRKLKDEILPAVTHEELKTFLQALVPKLEEHLIHIEHVAMHIETMP